MSDLSDFPTEIIREILSSLRRADLVSTSLVSHRLHSITACFLYNTVVLSTVMLRPFVRTIRLSQALAKHVTNLQPDRLANTARNESLLYQLLHALPKLHIITCTPLLARMLVDFEIVTGISNPTALAVGIQSLRQIECSVYKNHNLRDWFSVGCVTFMKMMQLPSIRKIRASIMQSEWGIDFNTHYAQYRPPAGTSSVTHLEIIHFELSMHLLGQILKVPQALTHFSYFEIGYDAMPINYPTFSVAMRRLKATLQFLELDFSEIYTTNMVIVPIGTLHDWPVLTRIKSPLLPLLGKPNTLETLCLRSVLPMVVKELCMDIDCMWRENDIVGQLVDLVERKDAYGLTQLRILKISHLLLGSREVRDRLAAACKGAGIEFEVITIKRVFD